MLQIKTVKSFNLSAKPLLALFSAWTLYYLILYIAGLDLISEHLISDAKFYVLSAEKLADYKISAQFNVYIEGKTFTERYLLLGIFYLSQFFKIPIEILSLWLSRVTHLIFVLTIFRLCKICSLHDAPALSVSLLSLIEIHILGGTTFGMRGFGFLPRDLVQPIIILAFSEYIYIKQAALKKCSANLPILGLCTLLVYPLSALHFCILILLMEIRNLKGFMFLFFGKKRLLNNFIFFVGLLVVALIIYERSNLNAINLELLQQRNGFMIFDFSNAGSWKYIRRFVTELALIGVVLLLMRNSTKEFSENLILRLFFISSGISIVGLFIESTTSHMALFLSRLSFFSHLTFMLFIAWTLWKIFGKYKSKYNLLFLTLIFFFSAIHFNFITLARWTTKELNELSIVPEIKKDFCQKILNNRETNQRVLVFSDKHVDLADKFRYICRVPVFVTYKDGGITLSDGKLGKKWNDNWNISSGGIEIGLKALNKQILQGDFSHVVFKTVENECYQNLHPRFNLSTKNKNYCMYQFESLGSR